MKEPNQPALPPRIWFEKSTFGGPNFSTPSQRSRIKGYEYLSIAEHAQAMAEKDARIAGLEREKADLLARLARMCGDA